MVTTLVTFNIFLLQTICENLAPVAQVKIFLGGFCRMTVGQIFSFIVNE